VPSVWKNLDVDDFVKRYLDGESSYTLASRYGVGRDTVDDWLHRLGIIRSARDRGLLVDSRRSPEERRNIRAAQHAAWRGGHHTETSLEKMAQKRKAVGNAIGTGEGELIGWLEARGVLCDHQHVFGRYNFDILAGDTIAVEVYTMAGMPMSVPLLRKRSIDILDAGWPLLYVWVSGRRILVESAADYVVTWLEELRRDPPVIGQYRVIRGDGQLARTPRRQSYRYPVIGTTVELRDPGRLYHGVG